MAGLEDGKLQQRCPCCGTAMVAASEKEETITLRCPACLTSDVRTRR